MSCLTLVLLEWAYYARTARAQALVERKRDYFEAARGRLGLPISRILLRHVLPNCLPPLLVIGALQVARAIRWRRRCPSSDWARR